jgi:hypothetical protein
MVNRRRWLSRSMKYVAEAKFFLVICSKRASIDARQSSGVRSSSFTAMNAGVASEAVYLRSVVIFSEPAHCYLV